jgi:hypothetical protein
MEVAGNQAGQSGGRRQRDIRYPTVEIAQGEI